jgi:small subunit ribosomal protein S6
MSKRYYETTFIVDSILEDEKVDAIITRYNNFFTKNDGEVVKTEKWGRRKLTYPIKKRVTGSYITFEFSADPSIIAKLERTYHLDDDVLRFLTVSYDKKSLETRNTYLARKEAEDKARADARLEAQHLLENPVEAVIPIEEEVKEVTETKSE